MRCYNKRENAVPKSYTILEMIKRNAAAARDNLLNEWETNFALDIEDKLETETNPSFSGRQLNVIDKIHDKVLRIEGEE
jgi:hypothetical protein